MGKGCTKIASILPRKPSLMHDQNTDKMQTCQQTIECNQAYILLETTEYWP